MMTFCQFLLGIGIGHMVILTGFELSGIDLMVFATRLIQFPFHDRQELCRSMIPDRLPEPFLTLVPTVLLFLRLLFSFL